MVKDLEDEDDVLVSPDVIKNRKGMSIKHFVDHVVPSVYINPEHVSELKVEDFDELTEKLEKMTLELQEKEENWNEERRQLEEEKIERSI